MSETDLDYFIENFEASGFRGPLNRCRNQERDFHNLPEMGVKKVEQPSCLIAGSKDVVRFFVPNADSYKNLGDMYTAFRFSKIIEGAGHWVQQEAPEEVNEALLGFPGDL